MKRKPAAPTAVPPPPTPKGLDGLAPALAVAYLALALATIPYGKPPATWYTWLTAATGLACVSAALLDPQDRRTQLTFWPIPVILGAWGLSIMGCQFPEVSFERSIGMGLYSLVFIAAQVVTWSRRTRDYLMLTVFLVVGACALDITWQRLTGHALYSDERQIIYSQEAWGRNMLKGSQGNLNDFAAVSILMPLASSLVPGALGAVVYVFFAFVASTTWLFSESRQVLLGWLIGLLGPVGARLPRKWAIAIALLTLLMLVGAVFALTPLRKRFITMWDNPLGSRGPVFIYGLDLFTRSPVFGTGPGLFGHYYVVGVREGWAFRGQPLPPSGMPWVHSVPIEILCETGLASAAAYAAAVFAGVRRLCRGLRRATQDREWLVALSTSVACFGVMSLVDMSFIKDWVRVVFWLLLGLCFASKQPWPTANATTHTTPEAQSPTTKTRSGRRGREAYKSG
jgi:hypothetical protein